MLNVCGKKRKNMRIILPKELPFLDMTCRETQYKFDSEL